MVNASISICIVTYAQTAQCIPQGTRDSENMLQLKGESFICFSSTLCVMPLQFLWEMVITQHGDPTALVHLTYTK